MVEWKNMAVFDRGVEYFEAMTKRLAGSIDEQINRNINRETLRHLRGGLIARELIFQVDQ